MKKLGKNDLTFIVITLLATFGVYWGSLNNGYITGWDDQGYIFDNKDLDAVNLQNIFSIFSSEEMGNYHPFTVLTYLFEVAILDAREHPMIMHFDNLLLHLLNTFLVFLFVDKLTGKKIVAYITTFLWGIHPMHVESVAWVSERKDVLYTFFFLVSLILYLKYREYPLNRKFYYYSLVAFFCSLMSKAMATPMAVIVVLIDYYQFPVKVNWANIKNGKIAAAFREGVVSIKLLYEKIPYFGMALLFGVISFFAQGKAVQLGIPYSVGEKIQVLCRTFWMYIQKLLIPTKLCGFYPYPDLPLQQPLFMLYVAIVLIIIGLFFFVLYKEHKMVFFCMSFFVATLILVLQIIAVGGASMADRYSYVPSIAFFMLIGYGVFWLSEQVKSARSIILTVCISGLLVYSGWLGVRTIQMCETWKDSLSFFDAILELHPNVISMRINRGDHFRKKIKNLKDSTEIAEHRQLAMADYLLAIKIDSTNSEPYNFIGVIYHDLAKEREAIKFYNKAISRKADNGDYWNNLAIAYAVLGIKDSALYAWDKAISLKKDFKEAINNRDVMLKSNPVISVQTMSDAIKQFPDSAALYLQRGIKYLEDKKNTEAIRDFDQAIVLRKDYKEAYYQRALFYANNGNPVNAARDYSKIIEMEPSNELALLNRAIEYGKQQQFNKAIGDFNRILTINPNNSEAYYNLGIAYHIQGKKEQACPYFKKAAELNHSVGKNAYRDICGNK